MGIDGCQVAETIFSSGNLKDLARGGALCPILNITASVPFLVPPIPVILSYAFLINFTLS